MPRLILEKLYLENFKSYYGKHVIGPIHSEFSCIVGANGSGKSNVLDAIQFLFGKKSKQLRAKRLAELIHNSEKKCTFCSVEAEFRLENGENVEIIRLKRTCNDKSQSKYYLNSAPSSFADVHQLLISFGVDLENNRCLILQGEIESISLMKPLELLEYIEDIVGTLDYKKPIDELLEKIDQVSTERLKELTLAALKEQNASQLKVLALEAFEYLQQKLNLVDLKKQRAKYIVNENKVELVRVQTENEPKLEQLKILENELETLRVKKREDENKLQEEKDKAATLTEKMKQLLKTKTKIETKFESLQKDVSYQEKKVKKNVKELKKAEKAIVANQTSIQGAQERVKKLQIDLESTKRDLSHSEKALDQLYKEKQMQLLPINQEMERIQQQLLPFEKRSEDLKKKCQEYNYKINMYKSDGEKFSAQSKKFKAEWEQLSINQQKYQQEFQSLSQSSQETKDTLVSLRTDTKNLEIENQNLFKEYQKALAVYNDLNQQRNRRQSSDRVHREIMKLKENGTISGIFDRLGNLGVIDAKYNNAISGSCGSLDNIVVQDTNVAKQCISYLKKQKIGRGKFLALDKMSSNYGHLVNKNVNPPPNVPRIFDLITVKDPKFLPVFYYAVRDTLVARNISEARQISFGRDRRWRVVTLEGQVIETSGVMVGSRKNSNQQGMKEAFDTVSSDQIESAQQQMGSLKGKYGLFQQKLDQQKNEIREKELYLNQLKLDLQKTKMTMSSLDQERNSLQETKNELKNQAASLKQQQSQIIDIETNRDQIQNELQNLEKSTANLVAELEKKRKEKEMIEGNELTEQKNRVNVLKKEMESIKSEINRCQVLEEDCTKKTPKLDAKFLELKNSTGPLKEEYERKRDELATFQQELDSAIERYEATKEEVTRYQKIVSKLEEVVRHHKNRILERERESSNLNESLKQLQDKIKLIQGTIEKENAKSKQYEEEMTEISNLVEDRGDIFKFDRMELEFKDIADIEFRIGELTTKLSRATANMSAIDDYRNAKKEYDIALDGLRKLLQKKEELTENYEKLVIERTSKFMHGLNTINKDLKEIYTLLTYGGSISIDMCDSNNPFVEGIELRVRPPKKTWKLIENLSGGEKTLSSLSLVFSLHLFKPNPIYVMDEIDAALDFRNVAIVGKYIKEKTKAAQFIVISLRPNMFDLADLLLGIYKTNNITQTVPIIPSKIKEQIEQRHGIQNQSFSSNSQAHVSQPDHYIPPLKKSKSIESSQ